MSAVSPSSNPALGNDRTPDIRTSSGDWLPGLNQNCLNLEIRRHAEATPWTFRDIVAYGHGAAEAMILRFSLSLEKPPVIAIERKQIRTLGTFRRQTGAALENEIAVNHKRLKDGLGMFLATLLHELLHYRQYESGSQTRGKDKGYHNIEFTRTASALGIPCDNRGRFQGVIYSSPFHHFLLEEQIRLGLSQREMQGNLRLIDQKTGLDAAADQPFVACARTAGTSKLKKWTCGCTNIRAAVAVAARCLRCGNDFVRA